MSKRAALEHIVTVRHQLFVATQRLRTELPKTKITGAAHRVAAAADEASRMQHPRSRRRSEFRCMALAHLAAANALLTVAAAAASWPRRKRALRRAAVRIRQAHDLLLVS